MQCQADEAGDDSGTGWRLRIAGLLRTWRVVVDALSADTAEEAAGAVVSMPISRRDLVEEASGRRRRALDAEMQVAAPAAKSALRCRRRQEGNTKAVRRRSGRGGGR